MHVMGEDGFLQLPEQPLRLAGHSSLSSLIQDSLEDNAMVGFQSTTCVLPRMLEGPCGQHPHSYKAIL